MFVSRVPSLRPSLITDIWIVSNFRALFGLHLEEGHLVLDRCLSQKKITTSETTSWQPRCRCYVHGAQTEAEAVTGIFPGPPLKRRPAFGFRVCGFDIVIDNIKATMIMRRVATSEHCRSVPNADVKRWTLLYGNLGQIRTKYRDWANSPERAGCYHEWTFYQ